MNRNNNNIVSIEKTIHEEIINILSKNFSNKNYDNDFKTTLKIINDIIKEKTIEEKVKISNIYDFENLNENEYNYNIGENHKNHKNLLDKIKKTYIKYFENLYSLNINEFNDNIPNTLNIESILLI